MSEREEVLREYGERTDGVDTEHAMADEIVRLRSQLAAVTESRDTLQVLFDTMTAEANKQSGRATTAERERDEARKCLAVEEEENAVSEALLAQALRERDEARRERDAARVDALGCKDCIGMKEHGCWCAIAQGELRHRAERAERVVEAAKVFVEAGLDGVDDEAVWTTLYAAVRALDAAEGAPGA